MIHSIKTRDGETLVPLHGDEFSDLIRFSGGRVVPARFGSGGAALVAGQAPWALPMLAEWRGVTFNDGAGI